jgi:leucyl aminopeptidase
LGKPPKEDDKGLEGVASKLGKVIATKCNSEKKVSNCAVVLPESITSDDSALMDISTSIYTTLYSDNRYRTGAKVKKAAEDLTSITLVAEATPSSTAEAALADGVKLATGVIMTKDIVNAPHNILNSLTLADTAKRIAKDSNGRLECTILGKKECEKRGMGAYLGVARGSETEPQFIHLTYKSPEADKNVKKVGIIGKGLLFDTGGYNIKTTMMELMKFDCGGAAAVLGAARAIAALQPKGVEAHFIVAACSNMISDKAMVASDVLTASNGKTIEVINTDAEGRLTLADALVFADKEVGCEKIIELSTLTGACMVSLGKKMAGVWTSNDDLAKELEDVSKKTGDKMWRMPLEKEYNEQLDSKIADIKNCGTRYGGAITAALFLQHFVDKKKPFSHIDIAGPVWDDKTGATGYGSKLIVEWVQKQGQ